MRTQVLLVDNAPAIRALQRMILRDAGYSVSEARDGAAALDRLRASPERMVVLLGTRNRITLVQAALQDPAVGRHAFVLVTALADSLPLPWRQVVATLHIPVVPKPFDVTALLETVAQAAMDRISVPR